MSYLLRLMASLGLNATNYFTTLKQAESAGAAFASKLKTYFATAFGVAAFVNWSRATVQLADEITDLADRLGLSTRAVQEWINAARRSGVETSVVAAFLETIAASRENAIEGNEKLIESYRKLGFSVAQLKGMTPEQVGLGVLNNAASGNIQNLITSLREIGGRSAGQLVPLAKDFEALREQFQKNNRIFDDSQLAQLKAIKTEILNITDALKGPFASNLTLLRRGAAPLADMFRAVLAPIYEFQSALLGGGSLSQALRAAKQAEQSVYQDRKRISEAVASKKFIGLPTAAPSRSNMMANVSERMDRIIDMSQSGNARGSQFRMPLSNWQRLGAAVRFNPEANTLRKIEKHTSETARNTKNRTTNRNVRLGEFGAEHGP